MVQPEGMDVTAVSEPRPVMALGPGNTKLTVEGRQMIATGDRARAASERH